MLIKTKNNELFNLQNINRIYKERKETYGEPYFDKSNEPCVQVYTHCCVMAEIENKTYILARYSTETKANTVISEIAKLYEKETGIEPVEYYTNNGMKHYAYLPAKKQLVYTIPEFE